MPWAAIAVVERGRFVGLLGQLVFGKHLLHGLGVFANRDEMR